MIALYSVKSAREHRKCKITLATDGMDVALFEMGNKRLFARAVGFAFLDAVFFSTVMGGGWGEDDDDDAMDSPDDCASDTDTTDAVLTGFRLRPPVVVVRVVDDII